MSPTGRYELRSPFVMQAVLAVVITVGAAAAHGFHHPWRIVLQTLGGVATALTLSVIVLWLSDLARRVRKLEDRDPPGP